MNTIKIQIETRDEHLLRDLMGTSSVSMGQQKSIPGGATVTFQGKTRPLTFGPAEIVELALSLGTGVTTGLVANWLSSKLRGRADSVRIDKKKIERFQDGKVVERVIEEHIHMQE